MTYQEIYDRSLASPDLFWQEEVRKRVVRDNGGHAVAMKFSLDRVYAMKPAFEKQAAN